MSQSSDCPISAGRVDNEAVVDNLFKGLKIPAEDEHAEASRDIPTDENQPQPTPSSTVDIDKILHQQTDGSSASTESKEDHLEQAVAVIDEKAMAEEEEDLEPLVLDERGIQASDLKESANEHFVNKEMERALELYTEALSICPLSKKRNRAVLYGNRAACCSHLDNHKLVVRECAKALEFDPQYMKAMKRKAKSHEKLEELESALELYKQILSLNPGDQEARERAFNLPAEIEVRNEKLKAEMMGKLKDLGNMFLKPFGLSTNNFQVQQDSNSGGYNIQFNQNGS